MLHVILCTLQIQAVGTEREALAADTVLNTVNICLQLYNIKDNAIWSHPV